MQPLATSPKVLRGAGSPSTTHLPGYRALGAGSRPKRPSSESRDTRIEGHARTCGRYSSFLSHAGAILRYGMAGSTANRLLRERPCSILAMW